MTRCRSIRKLQTSVVDSLSYSSQFSAALSSFVLCTCNVLQSFLLVAALLREVGAKFPHLDEASRVTGGQQIGAEDTKQRKF